MAYHKIISSRHFDGAVLEITLNSPKGNILDGEMMKEISEALDQVVENTKLVLFTAEGKNFSFGASVEEHTRERAEEMLSLFHGLFLKLIGLGVPTMAVVRGKCLGGALELAMFCNFLFAAEDAVFGQPEIKLGVLPPPASLILPLRVGQAQADEWILTGRNILAEEAEWRGLANRVLEDDELDSFVESFIQEQLLDKSAKSLRLALEGVRHDFNKKLRKGLSKIQRFYMDELMATEDANEGIQAFLEKRKPLWKNR